MCCSPFLVTVQRGSVFSCAGQCFALIVRQAYVFIVSFILCIFY
ncbi:hypothetical protein HMPREF1548_00006 [Clostridium sp. KLE 1755]|nr:hypothetical protein HMPREF1548_00006 [Clostridium sp. KLE 1755]